MPGQRNIFFCFYFLKISSVFFVICFHPCDQFFSLCVRGRRQHVELLSQANEERKCDWGLDEEAGCQVLVSLPDFSMEGLCDTAQLSWSWEDGRSCTLHTDAHVLWRVISCWLYLPTQIDFGFHVIDFWRTVVELEVELYPRVVEFTSMVPLPLTAPKYHVSGSSESSSFLYIPVKKNRNILANTANK